MAISIFPSTAAEFVSNNFVVDMNDTSNNSVTLENVKQAGTYNISVESGDTSFDIYLLDNDGALVAYTNSTTVAPTGLFQIVVVLGVADSEIISFSYAGNVNNADGEGDQPGAAAYLESITPSDLPTIDDTATVTGGNFGADTEIKFESGATVLDAKNITVNNSTELIVTRPDNLDADLDPWTVRAITNGVPEPTGSNANLLVDEVTAGAVPSWTTTSPLALGTLNVAYTDTLEATDADGAVSYSITSGSLPTGLSLDSSTGVISGTPTAGGQTFTATATDDGGNTSTREFTLPIQLATGGTVTSDATFTYHTFTSTDDFVALTDITNAEYVVIAGGGGGASAGNFAGGGGGAGGLLQGTATITSGTYVATIGAGGAAVDFSSGDDGNPGSDSSLGTIGTAIGGGGGYQDFDNPNGDGGSGGGGAADGSGTLFGPGSGTAGQGFSGGAGVFENSNSFRRGGGGGGAGEAGSPAFISGNLPVGGDGGDGIQLSDWASATSTGVDGGYYAGGAAGGSRFNNVPNSSGGLGGGGSNLSPSTSEDGVANTGGGGGFASSGGSGLIMVRY